MQWLPEDGFAGTLVGRAWVPGEGGQAAGPSVVALREDGVFDLSETVPTMSGLLEMADPAGVVRKTRGRHIGTADSLMHNSQRRGGDGPYFLAPCDLQVIKAAGVTFADSLVERVIEEQAKGDASQAEAIRGRCSSCWAARWPASSRARPRRRNSRRCWCARACGRSTSKWALVPTPRCSPRGRCCRPWAQAREIGIHPGSDWNNPEPEVVLAVNSRGEIKGATLGNDVNLRDFEGRSALLLGKAKDNNASCAIGPFIRLFDAGFSLRGRAQLHREPGSEGQRRLRAAR